MCRTILFILFSVLIGALPANAQIEQMQRARERMIRADRDRNRKANEEASKEGTIPKPKAAVMNVDVQTALTRSEYKSFVEAKPNAVTKISDGDTLWLYAKFAGKLGDYVLTVPDPENPGQLRYLLYLEIGPQNDVTTLQQQVIEFRREDLASSELKINLAPGILGGRSASVLLEAFASAKPGLWHDEIRLTNNIAFPRALTDNLAKSPIAVNLSGGPAKYRLMSTGYDSIVLRGSLDPSRMPSAGTFYNEKLKAEITAKLRSEGIVPVRFFFAGNSWTESTSFTPETSRSRKAFGVFTYKNANACFYGVATVVQPFDAMSGAFGSSNISLQKGISIPCDQM